MTVLLERDWIIIDGRLEPIDFEGFGDDRSPMELAENGGASLQRARRLGA